MPVPGTGARSSGLVSASAIHTNCITDLILGSLFKKRFTKGVLMRTKHCEAFVLFNLTIPPEISAKWGRMVRDWDESVKVKQWDPKKRKKNPYDEPHAGNISNLALSR